MVDKNSTDILAQQKFINLKGFKYEIEALAKPPIQCSNCKKFGHRKMECKEKAICGRCGENEHDGKKCIKNSQDESLRCVNCQKNHSSYYKGCLEYKRLVKLNIQENGNNFSKIKNNKIVPNGYYRKYSEFGKKESENKIDEVSLDVKLSKLENSITKNNEEAFEKMIQVVSTQFNNTVEEFKKNIKTELTEIIKEYIDEKVEKKINDKLEENNLRILYFLLDTLCGLKQVTKPNNSQISNINRSFNHHSLGPQVDQSSLRSYVEKFFNSR